MKIGLLNGPNLNLLGKREPSLYGNFTLDDVYNRLKIIAGKENEIIPFQSNVEGELIDKLQEVGFKYDGILLNAGGYTHTSVAIRDAIAAIKTPVIEIHISNIYAREEFRHQSMISGVCKGIIAGFGLDSYVLGLDSLLS